MKVSNIPIDGLDTGLHGNHRAIEHRLATASVASTVLQPSFFTSVIDKQRDLVGRGKLVLPTGAGKIAWINPADIAEVAAEALTRDDLGGAFHLTGPDALDGDEVAAASACVASTRRSTAGATQPSPVDSDPWLADSTIHLYEAVARGALAEVTDTVARVLNRPPINAFGRTRAMARGNRPNAGWPGRRASRGRGSSRWGYWAQPGSPVRANAAHASREPGRESASSSKPTNVSQPSTKLPNGNGMSMPWHADVRSFPSEAVRICEAVRCVGVEHGPARVLHLPVTEERAPDLAGVVGCELVGVRVGNVGACCSSALR